MRMHSVRTWNVSSMDQESFKLLNEKEAYQVECFGKSRSVTLILIITSYIWA